METVTGSVLKPTAVENQTITSGIEDAKSGTKAKIDGQKALFETSQDELGKQEFLNLLITSLRYQDPLNPASNEEFIAQMAQFSGLEATQNTNKAITNMAESLEKLIDHQQNAANTMSGASSTNLLGKSVRMEITDFAYTGSPIEFNVHVDDGEIGYLSVVNEKDEVINVIEMVDSAGNVLNGDFTNNSWDGSKADGTKADPGQYHFEVTTKEGSRDVGYVYVEDRVTGITYAPEGTLLTVGGKERPFEEIIHVSEGNADNNIVGQVEATD